MPRVLIVEDAKMFSNMLRRRIQSELGYEVIMAASYAETKELLNDSDPDSIDVALLDLTLPDAKDAQIVELVSPHAPSIVFTGNIDDTIRQRIWSKKIADYVLKEGSHSVDYLLSMVRRLVVNHSIKVLVVDDSRMTRSLVSGLLSVHCYQVLECADGVTALKILKANPDVKLVITDYHMDKMDGFELTKEIRKEYSKDTLSIIGISGEGDNIMSARFIKNGANDFLSKPFISEEFYCRVNHNIEMLENIELVRDASNKDFLTKLYNRRYFFDVGETLYAGALRAKKPIALAMLDIDFFKKVNDTYGHKAGDEVLKEMAALLKSRFRRSDVIARLGGEEFAVLLTNVNAKRVRVVFEAIRKQIEGTEVDVDGKRIRFTCSFGVATGPADSLESMLMKADELLYKAKSGGRNSVVMDID